jgi:hypothetical protein
LASSKIDEGLEIWLALQEKIFALLQKFSDVHAPLQHWRGNGFAVRAVVPHPCIGDLILIRPSTFENEDNAKGHAIQIIVEDDT